MTPLRRALFVLLCGFTLLGMPGAALGVAWPSIADDLARDLGDLGLLTLLTGIGYSAVSLASGYLTRRFAAGVLLVASGSAAAVGLVGYASADTFLVMAAAAIPIGMASGAIDAIGNAHVAMRHGARAMGFIHAAFGFGSMLAPLMMTLLAVAGMSWRAGFIVLAIAEVGVAVGFFFNRSTYSMPMEGRTARPKRTGSRRVLGLAVGTFFFYASAEGTIGFWIFTLLTEGQGVDTTVAGIAVSAHWGALFLSRLLIGIAGDRVRPDPTIAVSAVVFALSAIVIWWNPSVGVTLLAVVVSGFASGPIFPLETLLSTPRFGAEYTPWAVGYQLGAATAAFAIAPAFIGLLVNVYGPLVIAPAVALLTIMTLVLSEVLRVTANTEQPARV